MENRVYVIGLGVGDSGLLTLNALNAIKNSDIVITPQSKKSKRSVALNIIKDFVDEDKIKMFYFPTTNNEQELKKVYDEEAEFIEKAFLNKKQVSYVTIGDVSIYSTFNYLSERLKNKNIPFEIIPGIASFISLANRIAQPLVLKGESFAVMEMSKGVDKIVSAFDIVDSVTILKVGNRIENLMEIVRRIKPSYAYLGIKLYMEDERIVNLLEDDVQNIKDAYLSLAVIKK